MVVKYQNDELVYLAEQMIATPQLRCRVHDLLDAFTGQFCQVYTCHPFSLTFSVVILDGICSGSADSRKNYVVSVWTILSINVPNSRAH
jgi:hypothetical protein